MRTNTSTHNKTRIRSDFRAKLTSWRPTPLSLSGLHSAGMIENSPGFQPWDADARAHGPVGTAEPTDPQPSLRDLWPDAFPPNVETLGYSRLSLRDEIKCITAIHTPPPRQRRAPAGVLFTGFLAILLLGAGCNCTRTAGGGAGGAMYPPVRTKESQAAMTPAEALTELRAGNARFLAGRSQVRNLLAKVRATASGQYPFAVILSCLDSRVPVETVFDQSIGDVFNARVAGNVMDDDVLGSLEFGCKASGAKLILVLGHSNCGAVKGAIDGVELGHLTALLGRVKPAISAIPDDGQPRTSKNDAFVQKAAEANVRLTMRQVRERSPTLSEMLDAGKIALVGGMYDLATGEVHFIEN